MSWTDIAIAPLGVQFVGDGRPRSAGETDFGDGRFPPTPRTIQGVLRTALLRGIPGLDLGPGADSGRIAELVGPPERLPEGWQIAGPWLARWSGEEDGQTTAVTPWLPLPRYLAGRTERSSPGLAAIEAMPLTASMRWDLGRPPDHAVVAAGTGKHRDGYIGPATLRALLGGALPAVKDVQWGSPDFVHREPRTGLRIEPGKDVAQQSMLYTLNYHRFADDAGLAVRFRGPLPAAMDAAALTRGLASVGGKNGIARLLGVRSWSDDFAAALAGNHLPDEPASGERFWLWTTTPAAVDRPWNPDIVPGSLGGAGVSVIAAAVGRPERIGGFSLARGHSAPVRGFVPAGSAWLIELTGGDPGERGTLLRRLHDAFPLGADADLRAMGFGHTLVSRLPLPWG